VRNRQSQVERVIRAYHRRLEELKVGDIRTPAENYNESHPDEIPEPNDIITSESFSGSSVTYEKIEDVPTTTIDSIIFETLRQCGSTAEDELIVSVARSLGFMRTGKKIRALIVSQLRILETQEIICLDGGYIRIQHPQAQ
jgi:hypothetical protein